jgi:ADP-ribosylglycohydrolase
MTTPSLTTKDRYQGCLLGLAAGDALGTTLEFKPPGGFAPITDMVGGGPFRLTPGQWTDDTSMALCLAESLLECDGFDAADQMRRYLGWWRHGHWSSKGRCFDIGITTSRALRDFETTGKAFAGSSDPRKAGNGSIMRLAPVPLFYAAKPARAIAMAAQSSRTTHGAITCLDACRFMAGMIVGALQGRAKQEILSERFCPVPGIWQKNPLCPQIDAIAAGSYKRYNPPKIKGVGHVVQSLEAALWAFHNSTDFRQGALLAVNLGDDADTTGAVYGQIAGAFYGVNGIPGQWLAKLALKDEIEAMAERLGRKGLLSGKAFTEAI